MHIKEICRGVIFALALDLLIFPPVGAAGATDAQSNSLSIAIGKPLALADTLLKKGSFSAALAQVRKASLVSQKSAFELRTILEMKAAILTASGDSTGAFNVYDQLLALNSLPADERQNLLMAKATAAYRRADYATAVNALQQVMRDKSPARGAETLLRQSFYLKGDFANAALLQKKRIDQEIKKGLPPSEAELTFLASCYTHLGDRERETHVYVLLAKYYGKAEYWARLIHGLMENSHLSANLRFNIERLRAATDVLKDPSDWVDMVESAAAEGMPQLAMNLLQQGFEKGILGKGPQASRQERLRSLLQKRIAQLNMTLNNEARSDGGASESRLGLTVGYNLVLAGKAAEGLALMRQVIARSDLSKDDGRLTYAMALMDARRRREACAAFAAIKGDGEEGDLAQLWSLLLTRASH